MSIERMKMENFKGTRSLEVDFSAHETCIFGMNGTGKTTIADAFSWVLWNKDSKGNAPGTDDFREKPMDADGREIHNLDTMVEMSCLLDGKPFNLKRVQRENWVKKKGSFEAVYQGNASTYWINDVETKLTDFKARIESIAPDEISRLIGSLSAFNALEWQRRRQILLDLSGTNVDDHLLQRDEYRLLADELAERNVGIDDLRKILADQRKRVNAEIQMIPVRIDEARKALPTFGPHEVSDAEYLIKDMSASIETCDKLIAEARAQDGTANSKERILRLETEVVGLKRQIMDEFHAGRRKLETEASEASAAHRRATDTLAETKRRIEADTSRLERATAKRDSLRTQYKAEYEKQFEAPDNTECPTCGQAIPEDQYQVAVEKARSDFDVKRRAALANIQQQGKEQATEVTALEGSLSQMNADLSETELKMHAALQERDDAYEKIKNLPTEPDYSTEPRIAELQAEIQQLRDEQKESPDDKIQGLEARKRELNANIARAQTVLAKRDAGKETELRIEQLEKQQKDEGAKAAKIEQAIALIEKFVQDRCTALEESINSLFPTVRWKLFDIQINGGIRDVCVCMVVCDSGLVTYDSANTASQINADIEIVNVLSAHYGVELPLFVDNSERIHRLGKPDSQLVTLAVSTDSAIRVEHK